MHEPGIFICMLLARRHALTIQFGFSIQIEIVLGKSEKFDELMAAAAEEKEAAEAEEQQNWERVSQIIYVISSLSS